jgi:hypothetical protein
VQRRNAFRSVDILRAPVPPAAARAEFSQRENFHPPGGNFRAADFFETITPPFRSEVLSALRAAADDWI